MTAADARRRRAVAVAALLLATGAAAVARALPLQVIYNDADGHGFLDSTLGTARRAAFEVAVERWAAALAGDVPVVISAAMPSLGGTGASAVLASAGALTLHRNFGAPHADTWYAAALGNQLARRDLNGAAVPEIDIAFNGDVDGPAVLGSLGWYYGLDGEPGADIDFLTIALHEIGHGLGFNDTMDPASGRFGLGDAPAILERLLVRPEIGALADLLPPERLAAIVSSGDLFFAGPAVVAFNGSPRAVYAPDPFERGSSIAHWATDGAELMAPSYTGPQHDFGALLPALADMGWELAGPTWTPRSAPATPTATRPPRPSATPVTPRAVQERLYVSNFDDATVSVIDPVSGVVIDTVAVDDGPLGLAAAPDGTRVYVAGFRAGRIAVIRTGDNRIVARVPAATAPNGIAATPDGAFLAVTDTESDQVVLIAADSLEVLAALPAGVQPSGLAVDGSGRRAFVTNFSGAAVTVIDFDARRRRAIISVPFATASDGMLGIAVAPATGAGYVAALYGRYARQFAADQLFVFPSTGIPFVELKQLEAVVTDAAGTTAYIAGHLPESGAGSVTIVRMEDHTILTTVPVGLVPQALALSVDERRLYVANTGSNTISVIDTGLRRAVGTVRVGRAPMGIAAVAVPDGQCLEACDTPTVVVATPTATAPASATATPLPAACFGDCNGDGLVAVSELVTLVALALGDDASCPALDGRDQPVSISEIVAAVGNALDDCALPSVLARTE